MSLKHFLVLMLVCLAWGTHFTVMKLAMGVAQPFFYVMLRMGLVSLLLIPFLKWHPGKMGQLLLGGAAFGSFNYLFFFTGMTMTPASVGAVTIELYMPFATILSVIFLKEQIGWRRGLGLVLAFAGVVVVALSGEDVAGGENHDRVILGAMLITCGALWEAVGAITIKKTKDIAPLQMLAWFGVIGFTVAGTMTLLFERNQLEAFSPENRLMMIGTVTYSVLVGSLFGHATYYWLLKNLEVSLVTGAGLMTTVIGVCVAALVLGDTLTLQFLFGGIIALIGVGIIVFRSNRQKIVGEAPVATSGIEPLPGRTEP